MQISFDTAHTSDTELTALIALCASLGGRLPNHNPSVTYQAGDLSITTPTVGPNDGALPADDLPLPPVTESAEGKDDVAQSAGSTENASTPSATSGPSDAAIELDGDGIPWDARIHASTKSQTKGRTWTKLRNVDEVLYGQIHAELRELHANNSEVDGSASGPLDDTPPPPASSTPDENAPTDDTDVPPPPAPDALDGSDVPVFGKFADLVDGVALFNLPYVKLVELAVKVTEGLVTKFPDLRDKPDYWADFYELAKSEAA